MNIFKRIFIIAIIMTSFSEIQAQVCPPLTIPQSSNDGGIICLEGYPDTADPNRDICIENEDGFLNFYLNSDLADVSGSPRLSSIKFDYNGLLINGPNSPNSSSNYRDLTFDFLDAGKSKIRSFRGSSHGTSLQFLTNSSSNSNNEPFVRMHIDELGRIGIGTTSPSELLDVVGNATFCIENNNEPHGKVVIRGANQTNPVNTTSPSNYRDLSFEFAHASSAVVRSFRGGSYDTYLQFLTTDLYDSSKIPKPRMHINHDGKVLIGDIDTYTKPGSYRLYVANGGILTDKVKVAIPGTSNWSDHVFETEYKLMSLYDLEQFITENKHLPNIPSAEELVSNGLDLAEMQSKQMEKIEELTLYMIEMKKEIDELKKENEKLKKEIKN